MHSTYAAVVTKQYETQKALEVETRVTCAGSSVGKSVTAADIAGRTSSPWSQSVPLVSSSGARDTCVAARPCRSQECWTIVFQDLETLQWWLRSMNTAMVPPVSTVQAVYLKTIHVMNDDTQLETFHKLCKRFSFCSSNLQ